MEMRGKIERQGFQTTKRLPRPWASLRIAGWRLKNPSSDCIPMSSTGARSANISSHVWGCCGSAILRRSASRRFTAFCRRKGVTRLPIEVVHAVLHSALEHAARLGLVIRNPADLVMAPGSKKSELQIWDELQVSQFLVAVRGQRNEILYHLALATGMRRGELLGLQWGDMDWASGILRVERQVIEPEGGGFEFQTPKTDYGRRAIQLEPGLVGRMRQQLTLVELTRIFARGKWQEHNLIFPSTVGTPINGYTLSKEFHRLCQAAGTPAIRLHDLRHTAASLMLNHGIPLIVVSRILGHSKPSITMDIYGHLLPGIQAGAAELMERLTTPVAVDL